MTRNLKKSIEMIKLVAGKMNYLCDRFVFLGGATTGLLITDPAF